MQQYLHFALHHWDLFGALFVILALLAKHSFAARIGGYRELPPLEAVQLMNHEEALVVDVREESEFKQGHIHDAVHIPLSALNSRAGELEKHKASAVIVGCRSGARSARACGMLRKQGFEQVYNLRGGMLAWENANLPINRGGKRKKR